MRKIIILIISIAVMTVSFAGCKKEVDQLSKPEKGNTVAEIVIKDSGSIY